MEFKSFYMEHTQGEVNDAEVQVPKPSVLDDLLGVSSTSMDVDPSSVNGETELNAYMRVQQVANDTDPRQRGRGPWGGSRSSGRVAKTETGTQLLLHNR